MYTILLFILTLGMFLVGLHGIRKGLFQLSANRLKEWLVRLTDSPWKGLLLGMVITAILQSGNAVSIMIVGLVAANMIPFNRAVGIILGANIGTTVTNEILTLDMHMAAIPLAVIGIALWLFGKGIPRHLGMVIVGLAIILGTMWGFQQLAGRLMDVPFVDTLFSILDEHLILAAIVGAVITAIIQSGNAMVGIIMGFMAAGTLNLTTAIAILLGSNIGACADTWLAAIGGGKEAKLTAWSNIWLNVLGVILFFPFIGLLASIGTHLADHPDVQIAHVSVLFNVISSLVMLPFANRFTELIVKVHDRKSSVT